MNLSKWIRQFHRWIAVFFTLAVLFVIISGLGEGEPAEWVYLSPLLPLALLFLSGLYLFVLPYAGKWRQGRRSD